jgi:hypothetical protein
VIHQAVVCSASRSKFGDAQCRTRRDATAGESPRRYAAFVDKKYFLISSHKELVQALAYRSYDRVVERLLISIIRRPVPHPISKAHVLLQDVRTGGITLAKYSDIAPLSADRFEKLDAAKIAAQKMLYVYADPIAQLCSACGKV